MNAASRPPLFGRVMALTSDHDSLDRGLRQLEEMCSRLATGAGVPTGAAASVETLLEWRSELARHFESEESAAYFGVIVADRHSLRPTVAQLEREHAEMLAMSDRLILLFETRRWADVSRITSQLVARFRAHERLEGALMRRFLQPDE